jgi:hypothetical protein
MIILRPDRVTFAGVNWNGVERLAIDRLGTRVVRGWSEDGPHATFVDVPEQTVRVRVALAADRTMLNSPRPGDLGQLRVELAGGGDEGRRLVRIDAVVESVTHDIAGSRAVRTVTLTAVSDEGDDDPVVVTDAS